MSGMPDIAWRWKKQSALLPVGQRTSETGRLISSGSIQSPTLA